MFFLESASGKLLLQQLAAPLTIKPPTTAAQKKGKKVDLSFFPNNIAAAQVVFTTNSLTFIYCFRKQQEFHEIEYVVMLSVSLTMIKFILHHFMNR